MGGSCHTSRVTPLKKAHKHEAQTWRVRTQTESMAFCIPASQWHMLLPMPTVDIKNPCLDNPRDTYLHPVRTDTERLGLSNLQLSRANPHHSQGLCYWSFVSTQCRGSIRQTCVRWITSTKTGTCRGGAATVWLQMCRITRGCGKWCCSL